jgi:hypothetical protein
LHRVVTAAAVSFDDAVVIPHASGEDKEAAKPRAYQRDADYPAADHPSINHFTASLSDYQDQLAMRSRHASFAVTLRGCLRFNGFFFFRFTVGSYFASAGIGRLCA